MRDLSVKFIFLTCLNTLLFSCIEHYVPKLDKIDSQNLLVVEGLITDVEGPFRIKLSNTFEINNMQLTGDPVYNADIQIFDDIGNLFQLYHTVDGWYETENKSLKAVPGITYTLNITLEDGTQYESSPVLMLDVPEIGSVNFEEVQKTHFDQGSFVQENWLNILVNSKDQTNQTKYWKWDYIETWEIQLLKDSVPFSPAPDVPLTVISFEPVNNVEETCWVTVPSKTIQITSTINNTANEIKNFPIHSIGPQNDRLYIKYSILVKQSALSKEQYSYWKKLEDSNEETGSIYERTPSEIIGNIQCCNGEKIALGYFSASAVKTKRIFITPDDHKIKTKSAYAGCIYLFPDPRVPSWLVGTITAGRDTVFIGRKAYTYDVYCSDCRKYGTNVKPDFWK